MERTDNYRIQTQMAQQRFLTYDQEALIRKLGLKADDQYLYVSMLAEIYRIDRQCGTMERCRGGKWIDANSFGEVLTLLDLVCDSRENRWLTGRWKNLNDFGLMFHRNLLENAKDPWAEKFQENADKLREACLKLKGTPLPKGDVAYAIELFDGLCVGVQLWFGDEEFPPNLRFLWDENALMYIKYETMHFARGLILNRLEENMGEN